MPDFTGQQWAYEMKNHPLPTLVEEMNERGRYGWEAIEFRWNPTSVAVWYKRPFYPVFMEENSDGSQPDEPIADAD